MALVISELRNFGRNFCKKRGNVVSLVFILTVFTLAHFSLIKVQETPINTVHLEDKKSLLKTVSPQVKEDRPCNDSCVEAFIDNFLFAGDSSEDQNEKETSKLSIKKTVTSHTSGKGGKRKGTLRGRAKVPDGSPNPKGDQSSPKPKEEEGTTEDGTSSEFLLPTRLRGKNQELYKEDIATNLSSIWTQEMAEERRRVFQDRADTVKKNCQRLQKEGGFFSPKTGKLQDNLRWVQSHNMVWCPIFKSASTTWVKNLLVIAGEKYLDKSLHGRVRELYPKPADPRERNKVLEASMKVIIVRHPLDRLLSAYRDKMLRVRSAKDPYVKKQQEIVEQYKDPFGLDPTTSTISVGGSSSSSAANKTFFHPTFSQFLLKVKDDLERYWKNEGLSQVNMHWRPYWMTCGPCQINYDVIAQVETLGPDQEYIIRELGLQGILYNAHTHASNFDSYNDTSEAARHYFRQVPRKLLNEIIKFYQPDFDLFGYSPNPYIALTDDAT